MNRLHPRTLAVLLASIAAMLWVAAASATVAAAGVGLQHSEFRYPVLLLLVAFAAAGGISAIMATGFCFRVGLAKSDGFAWAAIGAGWSTLMIGYTWESIGPMVLLLLLPAGMLVAAWLIASRSNSPVADTTS